VVAAGTVGCRVGADVGSGVVRGGSCEVGFGGGKGVNCSVEAGVGDGVDSDERAKILHIWLSKHLRQKFAVPIMDEDGLPLVGAGIDYTKVSLRPSLPTFLSLMRARLSYNDGLLMFKDGTAL
jgi:hypothetical protein